MAAHPRKSTRKHRRNSRRKAVRFGKKEKVIMKTVDAKAPENVILHYLTKLRKLFNNRLTPGLQPIAPAKVPKNNSPNDENKTSDSHKPKSAPTKPWELMDVDSPGEETDPQFKEKVFNMVIAALEYGLAHDLLEKKGNCFVLKSKRNAKIANRRPTPGPNITNASYIRCNCSCSNCKLRRDKSPSNQFRSVDHDMNSRQYMNRPSRSSDRRCIKETHSYHPVTTKQVPSNIHRQSSRCRSATRRSSRSRDGIKKMCNCPQCRGRGAENELLSNQ